MCHIGVYIIDFASLILVLIIVILSISHASTPKGSHSCYNLIRGVLSRVDLARMFFSEDITVPCPRRRFWRVREYEMPAR